ncbi:MAG: SDR family oxidoreductase [Pseudomonadota bacterium]
MTTSDREFAVKTALVTGAGKRIGKAIALDLADNGWNVAVHYNSSAGEAEEVANLVREKGVSSMTVGADLSDEANVLPVIPEVTASLGPLTLLVNSASLFEHDSIETSTRQGWDAHMETNLRAPIALSKAFAAQAPDKATNGAASCVINLLDQRVWNLTPFFMSYTISKYALWGATQTLALSLAPNIRVNGIGPGPTIKSSRQTDEHFRSQYESIPLERSTDPSEICTAVRFILDSPSMTGQMVAMDGGEHLAWAQPAKGAHLVE